MKRGKILLSLVLLLGLTACNNSVSSPSASNSVSSSNIEIITGIEILGAKTVNVGKTINLTADVLGSDEDLVSWKTSDEKIATINENGTLLGISEGDVTVSATSIKDPSISSTISVSVILPKSNAISIIVEESENVTYDASINTYTIPLGQTFYVDTIVPDNYRMPDISYSLSYPDGATYYSEVILEILENSTRAKVMSFKAFEGMVITAKGIYPDLSTSTLLSSVKINIVDFNLEEANQAIDKVRNIDESSLVSSKLTRTTTTTTNEGNTFKNVETITHNSFINSSYVNNNLKTYENDSFIDEKETNYYQGKNLVNSNEYYYTFTYNENNEITKLYNSKLNDDNVSLFFDIHSSVITYGYSNILLNILNSSTNLYSGNISSFGNAFIYAYAEYEITSNSIKIISNCFDDDYDINYEVSLEVNYTMDKLDSFIFEEKINDGTNEIHFVEELSDVVYSTKTNDVEFENYLDINQYYLNEYSVDIFNEKDENGAFDYSNLDKYGAIEGLENGLKKYTTTYDKTIILKINPLSPSTANVDFDKVEAKSSDTSIIPDVNSVGMGIFAINAKKNDLGNSLPGKATFTFTSTLGYQEQVVIEFTKTVLKEVYVNFPNAFAPTYDEVNDVYVIESTVQNERSNYFFINTNPDEDIYTFTLNILEGSKDGITLISNDQRDEEYGYIDNSVPNFSYSIYGNSVGTYRFQVTVVGFESIVDENIYEITIKEPIAKEVIKNNIVGNTYVYNASICDYLFTFTDETTLTYVEYSDLDGYGSEVTFNYHIEDGYIIIDEKQSFGSNYYFLSIDRNIKFNDDFTVLRFYLSINDGNDLSESFNYIDFNLVIEPVTQDEIYDFINGKTFEGNRISVTFNDGSGVVNYRDYNGTEVMMTFNYSYNGSYLVFLDATTTNDAYYLRVNYCEFDEANQRIIIQVAKVNQYGESYDRFYLDIR